MQLQDIFTTTWQQVEKAMSIIGFWTILQLYGNNLGEKTASYWACHLLPDDVWEVNFQKFFSLDVIPGIDVPVMNEAAFESWSDDEPTVSSTSASANEKLPYLPLTMLKCFKATY